MLDYLKIVEGLTVIRDEIRLRLEDETRDRQSIAEFAEASLTQILGELVEPDTDAPKSGYVLIIDLLLPLEKTLPASVPAGASSRGDTYCSSCRADLWFNPVKAEYVALFDAPCPVTTNHKHSARR